MVSWVVVGSCDVVSSDVVTASVVVVSGGAVLAEPESDMVGEVLASGSPVLVSLGAEDGAQRERSRERKRTQPRTCGRRHLVPGATVNGTWKL